MISMVKRESDKIIVYGYDLCHQLHNYINFCPPNKITRSNKHHLIAVEEFNQFSRNKEDMAGADCLICSTYSGEPGELADIAHLLPYVRVFYVYVYGHISFKLFERLHSVEYISINFLTADASDIRMELDAEGYLINREYLKGLEIGVDGLRNISKKTEYSESTFVPVKIDVLGYLNLISNE